MLPTEARPWRPRRARGAGEQPIIIFHPTSPCVQHQILPLKVGTMLVASTCNRSSSISSSKSSRTLWRMDQANYCCPTEGTEKTALCGVSARSRNSSMLSRLLVHVVTFLLLSMCSTTAVDAFAAAVKAGTAAATRPRLPRRVLILPDTRADLANPSLWHHHLKVRVSTTAVNLRTPVVKIVLRAAQKCVSSWVFPLSVGICGVLHTCACA